MIKVSGLSQNDVRERQAALATAITRLLERGVARRSDLFDGREVRWHASAMRNLLHRGLVGRSNQYWTVADAEGLKRLCHDKNELVLAMRDPRPPRTARMSEDGDDSVPNDVTTTGDVTSQPLQGDVTSLLQGDLPPEALQEMTVRLFNAVLNVAEDLCQRMDRIEASLADLHVMRRTQADVQLACERALLDPVLSKESLRRIAEIVGTTHPTVSVVRDSLYERGLLPRPTTDQTTDQTTTTEATCATRQP